MVLNIIIALVCISLLVIAIATYVLSLKRRDDLINKIWKFFCFALLGLFLLASVVLPREVFLY